MEITIDEQENKDWMELLHELLDEKEPQSFSAAARYILDVVPAVRLRNYLQWLGKTEL